MFGAGAGDEQGDRKPLVVPAASSDPAEHADWVELAAVAAPNSTCSHQDLVAAWRRAGSIDAIREYDQLEEDESLDANVESEDEELERCADGAFEQLDWRNTYLGENYPFEIGDGSLIARQEASASPYMFLAALTAVTPDQKSAGLFEQVSAAALVQYLGGPDAARSYGFGFPRRAGKPKGFREAIEDLCREMGDGGGCKEPRPRTSTIKDAKLDVVAWVPFRDGRRSQLSVFGQCAAGRDWFDRIHELQPADFCDTWLRQRPLPTPLPAFFVPRAVAEGHWFRAVPGKIFFDRMRIARLLGKLDDDLAKACADWVTSVLESPDLVGP